MDTEKLLLKTIRIADIPEIPACAKIAMTTALYGERSIEELLRTVKESPSISLKVLKVANSPLYRRERPISNLKDAIVLLGYKTVKNIVLSISIQELFTKKKSEWFDYGLFFTHSLAVALLSEEFAKRIRTGLEEDLYVAGLLHDIGKAVIFLSDRTRYKKVTDRITRDRVTFREAEYEELGFDHTDAARILFHHWELPERLITSACDYHRTALAGAYDRPLDAVIVGAANEVAHIAGFDTHQKEPRYEICQRSLEGIGIFMEDLDAVIADTKKRIEAVSEALSLQKVNLKGLFDIISDANRELGAMGLENRKLLCDITSKRDMLESLGRISVIALSEKDLETVISGSMEEFCRFFDIQRVACEVFMNDDKSLVVTVYKMEKPDAWERTKEILKRGVYKPGTGYLDLPIRTPDGISLGTVYIPAAAGGGRFSGGEDTQPFLRQLALGLNNVRLFFTNKLKTDRLNILVSRLQEEMEKKRQLSEVNRLILEHSPVGIMSLDQEGKIIQSNPMARIQLGEELDNKSVFGLAVVRSSGLAAPLKRLIEERSTVEWTVEKEKKAVTLRIDTASIEKNKQTLLVIQDITEQKESERIVIQQEKMATLGELAAGIAHNLRSPLAAARGIPDLILSELGSPDGQTKKAVDKKALRDNMGLISDSMGKALKIIDSIMEFAKEEFGVHTPVSLYEVVEGARSLLDHRLAVKEIRFSNRTASCIVQGANKNLLIQAFINLLNNSIDAVENRGEISVTCTKEDNKILVCFEDNGKGIPKEDLERVFEPFFTTSKDAEGTGIGLSITRKIITMHGGFIKARRREKGGTAMDIVIPTE
ncbi:MAG: HDOD domain-containing protein [Spirochaetes bacterium]|nr:HDOD domain-containing protein [Spirochaetota bacterium]